MGDERIQDLLIQLVHDMSFVKAKLSSIEEQKLSSRIDKLEAKNSEHAKAISSLEKRNDAMEKFVRNTMQDSRKQQTGIFISMGLALFSALISLCIGMLF